MKLLRIGFLTLMILAVSPSIFAARTRAISLPPSPIDVSAPAEISRPDFEELDGNAAPAIVSIDHRFLAA